MERVSGQVSITNRNGSVTLGATSPLANINIENRTGEVKVTLPTNAGFSLDASTHDADLTNDFGLTPVESDNSTHLAGVVGAGGPTVHVETSQGDLSIVRGTSAPLPPLPPLAPLPPTTSQTPGRPSHKASHAEVTF